MLLFGKHKGTTIKDLSKYDLQYLIWLKKNNVKLDAEDTAQMEFIFNPLHQLNVDSLSLEELLCSLRKRGIVKSFREGLDENDDRILILDTIYGWHMRTQDRDYPANEKKFILDSLDKYKRALEKKLV